MFGEANAIQHFTSCGQSFAHGLSLNHQRNADVFFTSYRRDEIELLKNEAYIASAEASDLAAAHGVKAVFENINFALIGTECSSDDADESCLSAA
jgi:hypothetical protein